MLNVNYNKEAYFRDHDQDRQIRAFQPQTLFGSHILALASTSTIAIGLVSEQSGFHEDILLYLRLTSLFCLCPSDSEREKSAGPCS